MRGTAWMCRRLALGFQGQYFRTSPKIDSFLGYGGGFLTSFNNFEKAQFSEWSASCGLSYTFEAPCCMEFMPHVAAVASGAKMSLRGQSFVNNGITYTLLNLKDKRMWGYALGLNWLLNRTIGASAEVRFGDQKALHVTGELAF